MNHITKWKAGITMPTISREAQDFIRDMNRKQKSVAAVNQFIRQGAEFEAATRVETGQVRFNLGRIGLGTSSNKALNNGNGWNNDSHVDGGSVNDGGVHYYNTETSTSPFHSTEYREIKAEFERIMATYLQAAGGLRHSYVGSTHLHTAIGYAHFDYGMQLIYDTMPTKKMYRTIGMFMVRFLPVLKWLSMTNVRGARGAMGNTYDCLNGDAIYEWHNQVSSNQGRHSDSTDQYLTGMGRGSFLRVHATQLLHFENRMMDSNWSPTMMAAWMCLNRAIALFAYDMARQDFVFNSTIQEVEASKQAAHHHRAGWKNVPKPFIVSEWTLMKSYLTKYFKLSNSLDAIEVLDKIIDCPIPQFLEDNNINEGYDLEKLESHFAVRVREKDNELRSRYLDGIRQMAVPMAGNLNDFHTNVAAFLGVQQKQAVSLYQMFKRENVELEFMAGRLVYMGD
jgi:hypothetical protein